MLEKADPWFVQLLALVLAGYFLWSVRKVLCDFKDEVKGLKKLIDKLFDRDDNYAQRLSKIEGRCQANHPPGGRRFYDPEERDDGF